MDLRRPALSKSFRTAVQQRKQDSFNICYEVLAVHNAQIFFVKFKSHSDEVGYI